MKLKQKSGRGDERLVEDFDELWGWFIHVKGGSQL